MPTSLLEIVDLGDGEVVLQRSDDDREPLVTIRFSEESRLYIMDQGLDVAKAMIQAGLEAASNLTDQAEIEMQEEGDESDEREGAERNRGNSRVLH